MSNDKHGGEIPTITDQVGKVFVVVQGMRRCLICEGMFTRQAAAKHAMTICAPTGAKLSQ